MNSCYLFIGILIYILVTIVIEDNTPTIKTELLCCAKYFIYGWQKWPPPPSTVVGRTKI